MPKMLIRLFIALLATFLWNSIYAADQFPPVSGVIALSSGQVTIKTTSLDGKVSNRNGAIGQPIYLNDEIRSEEHTSELQSH